MFAGAAQWGSVRGYRIWSRREKDQTLRIALRVEVFAQAGGGDLAKISQRRFSDLGAMYDVGAPARVAGGSTRAVELAQEYIADLFAGPGADQP